MNKIVSQLNLRMQGPQVIDLQTALQACLDHDVLLTGNKDSQHNLSTLLARERAQQSYGEITAKAVGLFQKTQRLPPTNAVDQATAAALNALLQRWGLLEKPPNGPQVSTLHGNLVTK